MNGSLLRIIDPGPLRAPIVAFALRRTKDLDVVLETTTARDAVSAAKVHPPGTLRRNEDTIRWENGFGFGAIGVTHLPDHTIEMVLPLLAERIRTNVAHFAAGEPLVGLVDAEAGY